MNFQKPPNFFHARTYCATELYTSLSNWLLPFCNGETEDDHLTYRELDRRSEDRIPTSGIGVRGTSFTYPPGLDYLAAFFRMSVCGSRGGSGVSTSQPTQHTSDQGDRIRRTSRYNPHYVNHRVSGAIAVRARNWLG